MKSKIYHQQIFCTLLVFAMLLLSCKKVINIDFKDAGSLLVIEGSVTNQGNTQTVKLSKSVAVTDPNNFPAVSGATVTIASSDGKTYKLLEQTAGTYITNTLKGQPTKTYQLTVVTGNKTYTAISTMPNPVKLDSIGLNLVSVLNKDYIYPEVYYQDPAGIANYYHFTLAVNNVKSNNIFVYNDDLTDGRKVSHQLRDNDLELVSGKLISIEMQCIDKNIYNYWNGLDQNQNRGGASTTPANPPSNISNGALGNFSAYTVQQSFFVVP
ncbi:DUF4249 domain-containing protein [Mucilaginibacter arboris]|uniref:DUF4249 family protein n=1 Tax=Mucilaginibacter arboris TaxID=2682090 RepID=A0A7K1SX36_9SPHI|nr:DUF4249 domain-containing protein [Mucilaginibacter arboris]MVN21874.1 DUF4249 family protein [Mucilaginibacter arboris]